MTPWLLVIIFMVNGETFQTKGPLPAEMCLAVVREARGGKPPTITDADGIATVVSVTCVSPTGVEVRAFVGEAAL